MKRYDLVILGGGAAAFAAANTANRLKKNTLVINDSSILPLGGTCVNVGCVPSKIMLHQGAEYYYSTRSKFKSVEVEGSVDFVQALKETVSMVDGFREKNYGSIIEKQEYIDFREGNASFVDEHTIAVGKDKFYGKFILIATGASTYIPPIKGIEKVAYLTNKTVFELDSQPESVIIMGGGPMGLEFAQIFHHFGTKVTVLELFDNVLPKQDPLISMEIRKHLEAEGIKIITDAKANHLEKQGDTVQVTFRKDGKDEVITAASLFIASGLAPHTKDINAGNAGVKLSDRGFVNVNEHLQTNIKHIYAAGDVTGLMPLETVAAKQASFAASNMFEDAGKTINYDEIPSTVFTSPEVASVGITESDYMREHKVCLCSTVSFDHVEKALAIKDTRGLIRMVIHHETQQVLGVQVVGPLAADIITTATYAIKNKMTIDDIRDTVHVFPTISEVIKKAAQSFTQNLNDMACCVE